MSEEIIGFKRSVWIRAIAGTFLFFGAVSFLGFIKTPSLLFTVLGIIGFVKEVLGVVAGVLLWQYKKLGRLLMLAICVLNIFLYVISMPTQITSLRNFKQNTPAIVDEIYKKEQPKVGDTTKEQAKENQEDRVAQDKSKAVNFLPKLMMILLIVYGVIIIGVNITTFWFLYKKNISLQFS